MPQQVPLTILSGFLGAGKTTLLNTILHADHGGLKIAVLVNDFGAVNIDSQLIVDVDESTDTISLSNGCICCTIRGDLLAATLKLVQGENPPEYIIVEASGVADPLEVALTFKAPEIAPYIQLDSIVSVVDAEQIRSLGREYVVLAMNQVGVADIVIINKVDLVDADELQAVHKWIHNIIPNARVLEATHGRVPLELILSVGAFTPERLASRAAQEVHVHGDDDHDHDHTHTDHTTVFSTYTWTSDQPLSLKALKKAFETLPSTIYRAKGFLYLADAPEKRAVLHVVGRRVTLTVDELWGERTPGERPPYSQIVVIGENGGVDAAALDERFTRCISGAGTDLEKLPSAVIGWLRRKLQPQA